jgi:argininosuccinate lyase
MNNSGTKPLWGGRFSEDTDAFLVQFGASLDVDILLLDSDIAGSIAWAKALQRADVLTVEEAATITDGLVRVGEDMRRELDDGTFVFDRTLEDIHMTVEARLTALIGDAGAKLHTGRSRNDQVALDEKLFLKVAVPELRELAAVCQRAIVTRAAEHADTVAPSYTHLQQAQPVRLGHALMAWFWMLERDRGRLADALARADFLPLGAGAVAGSGIAVDREFLARELGFAGITENSIDTVSDRDALIEVMAAASVLMMHLSRIAEELILWSTAEFGFVTLPERYSTGSSMMPQKRNPDSLELVRGKTGRVYGDLITILTVMKGLPFSYAKDMQEDKEPLFDALSTAGGCLRIVAGVVGDMTVHAERMRDAVDDAVYATDLADMLVERDMPFRMAHEVVGRIVRWAADHGTTLAEMPMDVYREHSDLFDESVFDLFDPVRSTDRRNLSGGTGGDALHAQIEKAKALRAEEVD